jgi:hypothetical protein
MAYVLAGERGSRLMELTAWRAKPAVSFGGQSRIVDFALVEHPQNAFGSAAIAGCRADRPRLQSQKRCIEHLVASGSSSGFAISCSRPSRGAVFLFAVKRKRPVSKKE